MSFVNRDSESLEKIAKALTEVFNPQEPLVYTPLYRIAHALETIAKRMDTSFEPEEGME